LGTEHDEGPRCDPRGVIETLRLISISSTILSRVGHVNTPSPGPSHIRLVWDCNRCALARAMYISGGRSTHANTGKASFGDKKRPMHAVRHANKPVDGLGAPYSCIQDQDVISPQIACIITYLTEICTRNMQYPIPMPPVPKGIRIQSISCKLKEMGKAKPAVAASPTSGSQYLHDPND
jgi:hypothetical protein